MGSRLSSCRGWLYAALTGLLIVVWAAGLEHRPLWDPDEGRYAEIPREMVVSGDWTTPRLNSLLYFEKPPLQYWATAFAFRAFGEHNWAARLWSALTGFAGVLLVFYAARRFHSVRAGMIASLMLASGLLYFALGHLNTLDMGLTFFTEIAVIGLAFAVSHEVTLTERRLWVSAAWIAAALAILSKGLIGIVLPAGALVWYSVVYRDLSLWKKLSFFRGSVLLLLVAAPWFIAVSRANPDFAQFFFIHEHFTRFTTTEHHRGQPWWFFLPILVLGALPWTVPMLRGLWRGLVRKDANAAPLRLLAIWAVVVFVFFSVSGSKLVSYIAPMFPALAVLGGCYLADAETTVARRELFWSAVLPALALALAPYVVVPYMTTSLGDMADQLKLWCMIAAAAWAVGAVLAWGLSRGRELKSAVIALALAVMVGHQIVLVAADALAPAKSALDLARQMRPHIGDATRLYSVQVYPQSLPFYLERTMTIVNFRGELDFGLTREPNKGIPTVETFVERWRHETDAIAVMRKATYDELSLSGVPMTVIAEDSARVAVRR